MQYKPRFAIAGPSYEIVKGIGSRASRLAW